MDTRLDEPPGEQARLSQRVASIRFAHSVGLLAEVEGSFGGRRRDQAVRLLVERIAGLHDWGRSLHLLLIAIHVHEHRVTAFQAFPFRLGGDTEIADSEPW